MRHHTRPPRPRVSSRPAAWPRGERQDPRVVARAGAELHAGQPGLSVDVRQDAGQPVVTVAGELDLAGAGLVTAMLDHVRRRSGPVRAAGRRAQVDVDLARVTFVDSHGLASVVDDERTRVVAASEPVRRLQRLLDGAARTHPHETPGWYAASA